MESLEKDLGQKTNSVLELKSNIEDKRCLENKRVAELNNSLAISVFFAVVLFLH